VNLESRVLSRKRIRDLLDQFICVKVDPRKPDFDRDALRYKSTRYVPEVVFLDPRGEVIDHLEDRSLDGAARTLEVVLEYVKR